MRMNIDQVVGEVDTLPGCSQVGVSHSVFLPISLRGKGHGTNAHFKRLDICFNQLNYDMMLCTIDQENEAQRKILLKTGWMMLKSFYSRKTGHTVELWACTRLI